MEKGVVLVAMCGSDLHKKYHMLQGKDGDNKSCGKLINIVYPME
jgi:hypothetical protein